jgi:hypothetical protein
MSNISKNIDSMGMATNFYPQKIKIALTTKPGKAMVNILVSIFPVIFLYT